MTMERNLKIFFQGGRRARGFVLEAVWEVLKFFDNEKRTCSSDKETDLKGFARDLLARVREGENRPFFCVELGILHFIRNHVRN